MSRTIINKEIVVKTTPRTTNDTGQVLAVFTDFAEQNIEKLFEYLNHCSISQEIIATAGKEGITPIILGHYRIKPGLYDLDRVAADLLRWPPIAKRIAKLEAQNAKRRSRC